MADSFEKLEALRELCNLEGAARHLRQAPGSCSHASGSHGAGRGAHKGHVIEERLGGASPWAKALNAAGGEVLGWYHRSWDTEPPLQAPPGQELRLSPPLGEKFATDTGACALISLLAA